jgi:hypothetical protein
MGDAPVFFCLLNRGVDIHCKNSLILWDGGYRSGNVRDFYEYGISTDGDNNFSNNGEGYLQIGKFLDDMSDGLEEAAW